MVVCTFLLGSCGSLSEREKAALEREARKELRNEKKREKAFETLKESANELRKDY